MTNAKMAAALKTIAVLAAGCLLIGWGSNWEELKSAAASVTSLSADFVQEKHMQILARPLVSSGAFYFQSPSSLRWEYRAPVRTILLMHDNRTERYVDTGQGLTKETGAGLQAMQIVLEQISQWLGGRFDENPMFTANLEPGPKIVLTPKETSFSRMIHHIDLVLSERPGIIDSVFIYESEDSFTKLVFKNAVLNQPIDAALFRKVS
ncbi:MAG: outer membrane lipoprotein carrier protein LolA [Desulfobacterales bacterium]|jgi:outer membrane lipoprotein-sorting protein